MRDITLITKPDCQKCEYVKEHLPADLELKILDVTTVDGMAEAAFYGVLNAEFPVLIDEDEVITGAIRIIERLKSIVGSY
ncbi:MAG: hypothetical protein PWQ88_1201 [Candidatus Methanomethylophilaceae archaeon]|nr:hypothetical protein [Candidatus Methanomethylophilaceae archaeon]MDI3541493.1 hypothetical protein [Candidatus Methanomethylophilaceae archaeon]HIJ00331.1 hypothetical protein [Candidatus Methanomethylophilaceae archaeon]